VYFRLLCSSSRGSGPDLPTAFIRTGCCIAPGKLSVQFYLSLSESSCGESFRLQPDSCCVCNEFSPSHCL